MGDGTFRLSIVALLASCMAGPAGGREPLRSQEVKNPLRVDAALRGAGSYAGYTYVFRGGKYRRLITSSGVFDDGGSLPVFAFHLPPAYHAGVDAALSGAGTYAGKGYFFLGSSYARYDWSTNAVDYQGTLAADWYLPSPFSSGIDAAVNGEGVYANKAYFFRGTQYVRYDWTHGTVDAGYPLPLTAWNLPAPFTSGVDSVVPWPSGKLAFIRGDQMVLYNWLDGSVGPIQPHVMAVFSSGSHAEWYMMHREPCSNACPDSMCNFPETFPTWREQIEGYVERLWTSSVPFLAVCGSHQLISGARAGWQSVGHMGEPGYTVADELLNGYSRIPCFRQSEREVKPIVLEVPSDPLFAGIPTHASFYEFHSDEVRDGAFSSDAVLIAKRAAPVPEEPYTIVQALKYTSASQPGRIAYTTQFHPEIINTNRPNHGAQLVHNFVDLALAYWAAH